jgi:hypothetical protein
LLRRSTGDIMNFQEKLFETAADLRSRATEFAHLALDTARAQARTSARQAEKLKRPLGVLNQAGRELDGVVRRHGAQFIKQNSSLAAKVRDDVTALARTTFASLQKGAAPKARKAAPRKRKSKAKAA